MQRVQFESSNPSGLAKFIIELVKANMGYTVHTLSGGWAVEVTGY